MTSYNTSTSSSLLSDYEQLRARNIERNNKRLRELGLISALEEQTSNDIAWGRRQTITTAATTSSSTTTTTTKSGNSVVNSGKDKKKTTMKKRHSSSSSQSSSFVDSSDVPRRKSPRLQGLGPELSSLTEGNTDDGDSSSSCMIQSSRTIADIRKARVDECRLVREKLARMIQLNSNNGGGGGEGDGEGGSDMERIIAEAGKENPTATYGHCLMRVRTMSHKQLVNRIKTIERAKGKHCVIKMVRTLFCVLLL